MKTELHSLTVSSKERYQQEIKKATEVRLEKRCRMEKEKGVNMINTYKEGESLVFVEFHFSFALRDYFCATELSNHQNI